MKTFGIEIECVGMMPDNFALKLKRSKSELIRARELLIKKKSKRLNYENTGRWLCLTNSGNQYRIKNDTSIGIGFELTSPIYQSDDFTHFLTDIKDILKIVKGQNCTTNAKCGLHVHVGFNPSKLSYLQLNQDKLLEFWNTVVLPKEFLPKKLRRSYCSIPPTNKNKYSCINVRSRYDTVEYRMFNCCLNTRYIFRAVKFSLATTDKLNDFVTTNIPKRPTRVNVVEWIKAVTINQQTYRVELT